MQSNSRFSFNHLDYIVLGLVVLLFTVLSILGLSWGLPSRAIDKYLFGADKPWSGEKIYRLSGGSAKFSPDRGADVDADPLSRAATGPILLTGSEQDVAKIYLRYRLYTHQPDEMITMMALAGMNPRRLQLDPKLYQYGGLFIYPVGGLIASLGLVGVIDVRSDVVYYLDHPGEFGKFYLVARGYSALWGLIGVVVVFSIAKRLGGTRAGLLAALLFTLLPVVICMAHEGKPHLPGAVLMLSAVLFAMRYLRNSSRTFEDPSRDWWLMCLCCGASVGTVLSSWPILVLIPLIAWLSVRDRAVDLTRNQGAEGVQRAIGSTVPFVKQTVLGLALSTLVYLATNPYVAINAVVHREVLASNFGNSLAMYQITRIGEGFVRVLALTTEGATLPVLILGGIALLVAIARKNASVLPLAVPAVLFFLQFVLIGAGKPAEYGRFGIFTNTALAIAAACLLSRRWTNLREVVDWIPALFVLLWVAVFAGSYLRNFLIDATPDNSRTRLLSFLGSEPTQGTATRGTIQYALLREPAPYCFPPMNFAHNDLYLVTPGHRETSNAPGGLVLLVDPLDRTTKARRRERESQSSASLTLHKNNANVSTGKTTSSPTYQSPLSLHVTQALMDALNRHRLEPIPEYMDWVIGLGPTTSDLWRRLAETPISWANKPFRLSVADSLSDIMKQAGKPEDP